DYFCCSYTTSNTVLF
nr:immunoglobulin light chain junction region [Macaca mulatta]MOW05860.1 immunoglobulin light chain junction region [Macaca mulatta]MOW70786.1 immunoglobulin light chain junction region [Macaca mulatta]